MDFSLKATGLIILKKFFLNIYFSNKSYFKKQLFKFIDNIFGMNYASQWKKKTLKYEKLGYKI